MSETTQDFWVYIPKRRECRAPQIYCKPARPDGVVPEPNTPWLYEPPFLVRRVVTPTESDK
jgi:hypothetical protein